MGDMINGGTRSDHSRWRRPQRAAVLTVTAGVAVLAVACGGSRPSTGPGGGPDAAGPAHTQLVAFSHCVRSHGVPNFPDPLPNQAAAKFPSAQQLKVSDSQLQAAENTCKHLLPNRGNGPDQAQMQQELSGLRRFSECLRAHGMPNWPDPTAGSRGPSFNLLNYHGIGFGSPLGQAARRACQHLLPSQQLHTGLPVEQR